MSSSSSLGRGEGPSSSRSRRRAGNDVWPEPFVEDLAMLVAIDASRSVGRLAAAQALTLIFQVSLLINLISNNIIIKYGYF